MTNYNKEKFEESLLRLLYISEGEAGILNGMMALCEELFLNENLLGVAEAEHRKALHIGEALRSVREMLENAGDIRTNLPPLLMFRLKEMGEQ